MDWGIRVLRVAIACGVLYALWVIAGSLVPLPQPALWLLGVIIIAALLLDPLVTAARVRATAALKPARVDRTADGAFEFHPANEPEPSLAVQATSGMHAEPAESHVTRTMRLALVVGSASARDISRAIARGTRAATRALPGRGKVQAHAEERPGSGSRASLVVHIRVSGPGASNEWADAAEEAFRRELAPLSDG